MRLTKTKLLAIAVTLIIVSSLLIVLFLESKMNPGISYPTKVACVGDSITEGTDYPIDLQKLLGDNYTVGNFGVGDSTVLLGTEKPWMYQTEFQNARRFLPNIVIIMLGTNDARPDYYMHIDEFVDDYKELVGEFEALGESKPRIWLVKPPPIFNDSLGPTNANLIEGVIPRIQEVAQELNLPVIDVYTALANHADYFSGDGVHPNSAGAEVIAAHIYSAIMQNMLS
jgi:lysophospholipase L1-like esterase